MSKRKTDFRTLRARRDNAMARPELRERSENTLPIRKRIGYNPLVGRPAGIYGRALNRACKPVRPARPNSLAGVFR
jgi:hypothetical protein